MFWRGKPIYISHRTKKQLLRLKLLPKLIEARRQDRALRFWSAACSTGQDVHLAMLVREHFPLLSGWSTRIEGTDICSELILARPAGPFSSHRDEPWTVPRGLCRALLRQGGR